jgi:hypothetical protein
MRDHSPHVSVHLSLTRSWVEDLHRKTMRLRTKCGVNWNSGAGIHGGVRNHEEVHMRSRDNEVNELPDLKFNHDTHY